MTFRDHVHPAAAVAFNPDGSAGNITTSPYVQDCSSITTTGKGMYVDGSVVGGTRSMVLDAYTQFNSGGTGIHIDNEGYAQLVSIFTICTQDGILCTNGGFCSVTNSNSSFGTYGLRADGLGPLKYTGTTVGETPVGTTIRVSGLGENIPIVTGVVTFNGVNQVVLRQRQNNVITLTMSEPHGMSAGDSINVTGLPGDFSGVFDVIASDALTVSYESVGFNVPSTSTSGFASIFYTIDSWEQVSPGTFDLVVLERVVNPIAAGTLASFYLRSFISTSGHTFEYVGAGNTLAEALPELGGIPIQANEVVEAKGGKVFYTSTDQRGDFRIGNGLLINRADGTITGRTFDRSLFAVLTPYILAIEG